MCLLSLQDVKDREGVAAAVMVGTVVHRVAAEQSLVGEVEKERSEHQGVFESDSGVAIREVKRLIISCSAY